MAAGSALVLVGVGGGLLVPVSNALADSCPNVQPRYSAYLPDCRGYERVSPELDAGGVDGVGAGGRLGQFGEPLVQSSPDGTSVTFLGARSTAGTGNPAGNEYLAARGSDGWSTADLSPTYSLTSTSTFDSFSSGLSLSAVTARDPALAPGGTTGYVDLYLRDDADGSYTALNTITPPNQSASNFSVVYGGASTDFSHIVFEANDALTHATASAPAAQGPTSASDYNLYEWTGGQLRLVNVLPGDASTDPNAVLGGSFQPPSNGSPAITATENAISDDGSRIFWTDLDNGDLYVRENGTAAVEVDASQGPGSSGGGQFLTASSDGSQAFFLDANKLTADSTATASEPDLYEWDNGMLTDLTVDSNPGQSADVLGLAGASNDGSYLYFVANGVLASGATPGDCTPGQYTYSQGCNLYVWHDGTTAFIARLSGADDLAAARSGAYNSLVGGYGDWSQSLGVRTAEATPDGHHLVFVSLNSLTGYNNTDASTGQPDFEAYRYDATSGQLTCASCNPSGGEPIGDSWLAPGGSTLQSRQPRWISDDGSRIFFDSFDSLVPQATNGTQDVYEWEQDGAGSCQTANGCVYLISNGQSADYSYFDDSTPSGNDVFFTTRAQLVPSDTDQLTDLYDARVDGGFPYTPPAPPCSGAACKGPISPPPSPPTVATVTFSGPGDASLGTPATTGKVKVVNKAVKGSAFVLSVKVPAAGRITVSGADIESVRKSVYKAGTYKLTLKLTANAKQQLKRKRRLKVKVRVGQRPSDGSASSATVSITVKAR